MAHWEKLPAVDHKNVHHGCLNCGGTEIVAPLDMVIGVGFGYAGVTRDGAEVFSESYGMEFDDLPALSKFEEMAAADPDHDWRATLDGPLRGRTYQRHDVGKWVLVESNGGFA